MKKWLNNPGLKITALVFAILIWLIIVNVNDPIMTRTINSVPVRVVNASYVESLGDTYKIRDGYDTIAVRVRGNRSVVEPLTADDIIVQADLTEIVSLESDPITVPVRVTVNGLSANNVSAIPAAIEIDLEELVSADFVITGVARGTPGSGYEVGRLTPNVEKVKITGPATIINIIDRVEAPVDVTSLSVDTTRSTRLVVYDKNGTELTESQMSYLNFNVDEGHVAVGISLYRILTGVTLEVEGWVGKPASGYQVISTDITPQTISVAGPEDALKAFEEAGSTLTLSKDLVDVSGADAAYDLRIDDLGSYLPDGITLAEGASDTAIISVEILPYNSTAVKIPVSAVEKLNLADGMNAVISGTTINVGVKGSDASLKSLKTDMIGAAIDLAGLEAGTHTCEVMITLPEGYEQAASVTCEVTIAPQETVKTP